MDRFARLQAQWSNVHVDFPLLQRMALPIVTGYAGIKIHETRIIRLLEVLLPTSVCALSPPTRHRPSAQEQT